MKQKHLWVILVAIVILGAAWWWMDSRNKVVAPETPSSQDNQSPTTSEEPTPETPPQQGQATNQFSGNNTIAVSDQIGGSNSVTIDNINLDKAGFIVIAIPDASGKLSQILGTSKLLSAGKKLDLEIPVKATLDSNINYTALIYTDDGDRIFNINKDTLIEGPKAKATFTAK